MVSSNLEKRVQSLQEPPINKGISAMDSQRAFEAPVVPVQVRVSPPIDITNNVCSGVMYVTPANYGMDDVRREISLMLKLRVDQLERLTVKHLSSHPVIPTVFWSVTSARAVYPRERYT